MVCFQQPRLLGGLRGGGRDVRAQRRGRCFPPVRQRHVEGEVKRCPPPPPPSPRSVAVVGRPLVDRVTRSSGPRPGGAGEAAKAFPFELRGPERRDAPVLPRRPAGGGPGARPRAEATGPARERGPGFPRFPIESRVLSLG